MKYVHTTVFDGSFEDAVIATTEALKTKGFGVLTQIDFQAAMKSKLDKTMPPYLILGACHPQSAYKAVQTEEWIGAMLPCNVVVRENNEGKIEIGAISPKASMSAVDNPNLGAVALSVEEALIEIINMI